MTEVDHEFLAPLFLGSSGENNEYVERLLVAFFRDHVFWRRNFHPEDPPSVSAMEQHRESFVQHVAQIEQELYRLCAQLKKSTPSFAPRYIGHMCSDVLTPGLLAQIITLLYNPNNVVSEVAPVTLDIEVEVGRQLATMFGMRADPDARDSAWGHITSGGTVANYEGLWLHRAIRFFAPAVAVTFDEEPDLALDLDWAAASGKAFGELDTWGLFNLSLHEVFALREALDGALKREPRIRREEIAAAIDARRVEHLGVQDFLARHGAETPVVVVPATAHYSWKKAAGLFGFGTANLWKVDTDQKMRMDPRALESALERALEERRVVLAVVAVLGTTEFGTIDPVHELLAVREDFRNRGLYAGLHVDAAWGGYLASLFREPDGGDVSHEAIQDRFRYFPSEAVYRAFMALRHVDSVTVDPHKLGYLPFGAGAIVGCDRRMTEFVGQRPAYIYDEAAQPGSSDRLAQLGDYILEGSKPGAAAAAAYVTHRVMPLDTRNFGKLLAQTIRASEYFFDRVAELDAALEDLCHVCVPIEPDTNLICLVLNPAGNDSAVAMNAFGRRVFRSLAVDVSKPLQTREFIGSYTSIFRRDMSAGAADGLCARVGLDPATFVAQAMDPGIEADHVFVIRHTLMNPWLTHEIDGRNYLDLYCEYLAETVRQVLSS